MRAAWMVIVASVALALLGEREAQACSCAGTRLGTGRLYLGADGTLPPDGRGFAWTGAEPLAGSTDRVTVVRVEKQRKVPVKHTIAAGEGGIEWIVAAGKFKPGQVYEVTLREGPQATEKRKVIKAANLPPSVTTTAITIAATPLKLTQASLQAGAPAEQELSIAAPGICAEGVGAAGASLRVELPPEVEPLRDYLVFATRVDGQPWAPRHDNCEQIDPGRAWTEGAGTDLVFTVCQRSPEAEKIVTSQGGSVGGVAPGLHRVEIEVATPDRKQVITTPAVDVMLACAASTAEPVAETEVPASEPPASETPEPAQPQEPPPVAQRGCAVGEPGFAWVVGACLWWRRRRRANGCL
ncbi:hypothetical protein [Nannocystis sp. SCPEA4]|uniref:hypothetical protein n=1 Tax=Nannocystis sp. SCPEA4 TaxID=2996787 RepID=UPI00226FDB3E|nr:hypothetical protein [Nannocystis sp. SCPEA4]MCY1058685.1 hypothetical protein [Nannocystis sp. SCPEA4]